MTKRIMGFLSILMFLALQASPALAAGTEGPFSAIDDKAQLLPAGEEQKLLPKLYAIEQQQSFATKIITVKSLGDQTIENYAKNLNSAQPAAEGFLYIIIADEEKQIYLQPTGALDAATNASLFAAIAENVMAPGLRAGNYTEAIDAGVQETVEALERASSAAPPSNVNNIAFIVKTIMLGIAATAAGAIGVLLFLSTDTYGRGKSKERKSRAAQAEVKMLLSKSRRFLEAKDEQARKAVAKDFLSQGVRGQKTSSKKLLQGTTVELVAQSLLKDQEDMLAKKHNVPRYYYSETVLAENESLAAALLRAQHDMAEAHIHYGQRDEEQALQLREEEAEANKFWRRLSRKTKKDLELARSESERIALIEQHYVSDTMASITLLNILTRQYPASFPPFKQYRSEDARYRAGEGTIGAPEPFGGDEAAGRTRGFSPLNNPGGDGGGG